MASKDFKPLVYYYARRDQHDLLLQLCESNLAKKGKDPIILFWKAYALGKAGYIQDSLRQLDVFHNRKDLQLPVTLAMVYFHKNSSSVDQETVESLSSELSIAEDVTKEAGIVLAARFALITGDYETASRLSQKIAATASNSQHATPIELEAMCIDSWSSFYLATQTDDFNNNMGTSGSANAVRSVMRNIETLSRSRVENCDLDMAMLWVQCKQALNSLNDAIDILNQIVAVNSWFTPALIEKVAIQLQQCSTGGSGGDWEPVLDTAQRLLDEDKNNFDALLVVALHSFSQEGELNDALIKLDDLDRCLLSICPSSVSAHLTVAVLISQICCRNTRAIQLCSDILDRCLKRCIRQTDQAIILTEIGRVKLLLGPNGVPSAMLAFREAIKKEESESVQALLGMVQGQLIEGEVDDAEAQLELLAVMHDRDELGVEYHFMSALLAKKSPTSTPVQQKQMHLQGLNECRQLLIPDLHWNEQDPYQLKPVHITTARTRLMDPLYTRYAALNPDMLLSIALEYLSHQETYTPANVYLPSTTATMNGTFSNSASVSATSAINNTNGINPTMTSAGYNMTTSNKEKLTGGGGDNTNNSSNETATEISSAVQSGLSLLKLVLQHYPGFVCVYIETARALTGIGRHEDACRTLHQCMNLQPRSTAALLLKAKVEACRMQTASADRCLEQALSYDFSIRSSTLYRLIRVQVWSLQGKYNEAITDLELLVQLPELRAVTYKNGTKAAAGSSDGQNNQNTFNSKINNRETNNVLSTYFSYADSFRITDEDKITAFVLLGYLYGRTKRMKDAKTIFNDAKSVFIGTGLEYVLLLASSQFAVDRKDYEAALKMLDKVHDNSPAYNKAQLAKADILLHHLRDQDGYLRCFQQLVEKEPTGVNYISLGDACLRILRPEAAVAAFESAYEKDRGNIRLRGRIGRILISTHEYFRAVDYYETAIREVSNGNNNSNGGNSNSEMSSAAATDLVPLSHDLARLLLKLGRGEASVRVLTRALHESHHDMMDMQQDVTTLLLLTDVYKQLLREEVILETLKKAYDLQKLVLSKARGANAVLLSTEAIDKEKRVMSNIAEIMGSIYLVAVLTRRNVGASGSSGNNTESATAVPAMTAAEKITFTEQYLNESVSFQPTNGKALLSLAKLYMHTNDIDKCGIMCKKVLVDDNMNEEASILLSETIFQSSQPDIAIEPLENLLKIQPNNYLVLSRFISLLRRVGNLEKVKVFLQTAEMYDIKSKGHPGYYYCQGLYARYTNDISNAVLAFNKARRDSQWGEQALTQMIELYLNPDQVGVWEHGTGSSGGSGSSNKQSEEGISSSSSSHHMDESTAEQVAVAQALLEELRPVTTDKLKYTVLENQYFLATRQRSMIDKAMTSFQKMLDDDADYLPAVLGMASGFMIEKSEHKARNLLKRVSTMEKSARDGEDFNTACLLLAKFYVDQTKYSAAQELCKKCLAQDRSSAQAWDILGLSMEKELDYEHAVECFEKAWKLEFEASAAIGYKLAFCYLKLQRYTDAIDVCESVLALYPDYPRIREEILKKAINNIRGG